MRHRKLIAAVASIAAVGGVSAATGSAAPAPAQVAGAAITPYTTPHSGVLVDAGVTGEAHAVTTASSRTIVRVAAQGLAPGGNYAVHVHFGSCTDYLGHFQYQHPGPASRDNEVWLDLDANAAGRADDQVQVAAVDLDQTLSLVIHQHSNPDTGPGAGPPGPRLACGDLELDR
jgi:hypothetical protein